MAVIKGTISGETLTGGSASDYIYGYGGSDTIIGGAGNDWIIGGSGNDTLTGGTGTDLFVYDERGFGSDTITDFASGDKIDLSLINIGDLDSIKPYITQVGSDVVIKTYFSGDLEQITIKNATVSAVLSAIRLNGNTDPLTVSGTISTDYLFGGRGHDRIFAGGGSDEVNGGLGNDYIYGQSGNDLLRGGAGNDFFAYNERGYGSDTIADFATGDRIDFRGLPIGDLASIAPYMTQVGGDVVISTYFSGDLEQITVKNATLAAVKSALLFNTSGDPLTVSGTISADYLFGGTGQDRIYGGGGSDHLNGGTGNDRLYGGTGNDQLRGGASTDYFAYDERGFGSDTIVDFTSSDRIDLRELNIGDASSLTPYIVQSGDDVVITTYFSGDIERITIQNTTVATVKASLLVDTATDPLTISGTISTDYLFGGRGQDRIYGGGSADHLNGGSGNDYLNGGTGNDLLRGGTGADYFVYDERGFGADTIADFASGDKIDLRGMHVGDLASITPYMTQVGSNVVIKTYFSGDLEQITIQNATLAAVKAALVFDGSLPRTINGTISTDYLFGGQAQDRIYGGGSADHLNGGGGNDYLNGGTGNDQLRGGTGTDFFVYNERGFGTDTIVDFASGDKIDLRGMHISEVGYLDPYIIQSGGNVVIKTFFSGDIEAIIVQNATIAEVKAGLLFDTSTDPLIVNGTISTDFLFGARGQDKLYGGGGADRLFGGNGDDYLQGGDGGDQLRGGAGADRFVFDAGESPTSGTLDRVTDFYRSQGDKIDLRPIDTNPDAPGDQALTYVGGAFSAANQARITTLSSNLYLVEVNLDTDPAAEMAIQVVSTVTLNSSDLLL